MNITLKNLLPNGDFDSGWSSNTEFPTCTVDFSGDQHLYGTKSAKVTSTITNTEPLPSYSPTYGIYLKVNGTWTCVKEYNEST